jgi:hypothetical protein
MTTQIIVAAVPVLLVIALYLLNKYFRGMKTNILGLVVAGLGGLQTVDLGFLPKDTESALLAGSGLAVLIVSYLTERK